MSRNDCPFGDTLCDHARSGEDDGSLSQRAGRCDRCREIDLKAAMGIGERLASTHTFVGATGERP